MSILYTLCHFMQGELTDARRGVMLNSEADKGGVPMKIVILNGASLEPEDLARSGLASLGELVVYQSTAPEETAGRLAGAEAVFVDKTVLTGDLIRSADKLRFIGVMATGYDRVDLDAAGEKGIIVCNAPGYSAPSVAQLVMAMILETAMAVGEYNRDVHAGAWVDTPNYRLWTRPLTELSGKTLGIFGCGDIGRRVAKMARGFDMEVIACSRRARPGTVREGIAFVSREELFARSRYLTLNCPLNSESRGIINRDTIALMPPGAVIVNAARGALVVEEDVASALESGRLGWYCADALTREPMTGGEALLRAPRCILTPHMGWATRESRRRLMDICVENLRRFLDGEPVHVVN